MGGCCVDGGGLGGSCLSVYLSFLLLPLLFKSASPNTDTHTHVRAHTHTLTHHLFLAPYSK